jgi:hypothetical protein
MQFLSNSQQGAKKPYKTPIEPVIWFFNEKERRETK